MQRGHRAAGRGSRSRRPTSSCACSTRTSRADAGRPRGGRAAAPRAEAGDLRRQQGRLAAAHRARPTELYASASTTSSRSARCTAAASASSRARSSPRCPRARRVAEAARSTTTPSRIAIIGRPNAGKSSLVNRLARRGAQLVDVRPGTTRDPSTRCVERDGKRYVLVDTAGIRRKAKVAKEDDVVEAVSVLHAIRAIERCDVVVLMCRRRRGRRRAGREDPGPGGRSRPRAGHRPQQDATCSTRERIEKADRRARATCSRSRRGRRWSRSAR